MSAGPDVIYRLAVYENTDSLSVVGSEKTDAKHCRRSHVPVRGRPKDTERERGGRR